MKSKIIIVMLLSVLFAAIGQAQAKSTKELQAAFKARYGQVSAAKQAGQIGETDAGYLAVVKGDASDAIKSLVKTENADRKLLYEILAAKDSKLTAGLVAARNSMRNFDKAKKGEYLQRNGKWTQK